MKQIVLIAIFCALYFHSFAQIDHLESRLKSTQRDTQRVNLLNRLAPLYYITTPEKTEAYANQAFSLADSLHYQKGIADAYLNQSLPYKLRDQNAIQLEHLLRALPIFKSLHDSLQIANTLTEMAIAYHQLQDFKAASNQYNEVLILHQSLGNKEGEALVLRRLGNIEGELGDRQKSIHYYHRALAIEKKIKHEEGIANVFNNLGVGHYDLSNYDSALYYYKLSMPILLKLNNRLRLPAAYLNQARVYLAQGNIEKALEMAGKGLPIAQEMDNRTAVLESSELHVKIYLAKKDYRKAFEFLQLNSQAKDSLRSGESAVHYAELKSLIETQNKESEIQLLKKEQEWANFKQWITFAGLGIVLIAGGLVIFYQRKSIENKKQLLLKTLEANEAQHSLAQAELENRRLAERELQHDLEFRHKELVTYTLSLAQKNALMEEMREGIREVLNTTSAESKIKLSKLIKLIDHSLESEKDWDEFKMYFEKVHSRFFENLKKKFPDLSQADLKLCALISLNLSMKEMAELMGISPESVKMARYRLRKKLELATEENLVDFLSPFKSNDSEVVTSAVDLQ